MSKDNEDVPSIVRSFIDGKITEDKLEELLTSDKTLQEVDNYFKDVSARYRETRNIWQEAFNLDKKTNKTIKGEL